MAQTQAIKRRLRSIRSTKQITKAMELVAASKMRRAQEAALLSRPYRNTALEVLDRLSDLVDVHAHPLYKQRPVRRQLIVVVSSDRGLAGAYNSNVLKYFVQHVTAALNGGARVDVIAIGRQAARLVSRLHEVTLIGAYDSFPDRPTAADLQPIIEPALKQFTSGTIDAFQVIYTDYVSSVQQEVRLQTLLPAAFDSVHSGAPSEADVEPSPLEVLEKITPRLVEVQLMQALLESSASEHSMRMMAMKNASDNASDLIDDLTLAFNSARQAAITQELAEITGGAEAIN